ncbi:MAG: rhodanese-like domain-containing protein [Flavobacteriaceae bacterium]|nr:rhodanese-like domain-containing protein [Flavobacteriaceae bacterium]
MKAYLLYILALICYSQTFGQSTMHEMIANYNKETVPYVTVKELLDWKEYVLLDTREKTEFDISHIKNSNYVGYSTFNIQSVLRHHPDKNKPIVVY